MGRAGAPGPSRRHPGCSPVYGGQRGEPLAAGTRLGRWLSSGHPQRSQEWAATIGTEPHLRPRYPAPHVARPARTMRPKMPTMCSSTMGLVDPLGWPPAVFAGTHTAAHIISSIRAPEKAAGRMATPRMSATPIPRSPIMNSQSIAVTPARDRKKAWNGPTLAPERNPLVGEPPWIHASLLDVE